MWNLFKGPLEALVGVAVGVVIGVTLWYFPQRKSVSVNVAFLLCAFKMNVDNFVMCHVSMLGRCHVWPRVIEFSRVVN